MGDAGERAGRAAREARASEQASQAAREARASEQAQAAAMVFSSMFCASYTGGHWLNLVNV
jgi:hypothetical protein